MPLASQSPERHGPFRHAVQRSTMRHARPDNHELSTGENEGLAGFKTVPYTHLDLCEKQTGTWRFSSLTQSAVEAGLSVR